MASSSASFVQKSFKYDVFLSFRGEDTRKNFVDHLYLALQQKGIHTYKDEERIKKGENISDELIGSIEDSKSYIIVFSKNYASSSWCLAELLKIMECQKTGEHTAYPVFYDVEPTQVRNQLGEFGNAFAKHENKEAAGRWRAALREAADLAGWELKNTANGHEAKFIQKIIEELSLELRAIDFNIDEKLVGMETRINDVLSSLRTGFDDVRMIGIKGMGGAGKTTLAGAVFDQISSQFEGKSFVENVREVSKLSGLKLLQKQILSDVLNDDRISLSSVHEGRNMMKRRLPGKKVLLVLDDVDHIEQLEALAGETNWFKPGSRIIITTRDEQVLVAHQVMLIHNVQLLLKDEAIRLFNRYAFGRVNPNLRYQDLSRKVVRYAAGLPLTIKVLGSLLCGKNEPEWVNTLERLNTIPLMETLKKLEISYIDLEEDYKEIFLNVACILKGWKKADAIEALESCGFYAINALRVLEQKSLITIGNPYDGEYLGMHDHIEEMGKNIVRRLHPDTPNKHSRLWIDKEIEDILANDMGTQVTKYIRLYSWALIPTIVMKGLGKMKELRFLDLSIRFPGESESDNFQWNWEFPNALHFLRWHRYPFRSFPKTHQAENLVTLTMTNNNIEQLWEGGERKVLNKLKFLDLSYSMLRKFDIGLTPNLERLTLKGCRHLIEVNMLVGLLKLKSVDLSLSRLRTLDLGSAPNVEVLDLAKCSDLVELHLPRRRLKLRSLKLNNTKLKKLDIGSTPNLEKLDLGNCFDLEELHTDDGCQKLTFLNNRCSKLRNLDLRSSPNLELLDLKGCTDLVELHLPRTCLNLRSLNLDNTKLKTLDIGSTPNLEKLDLKSCYNLVALNMAEESLKKVVYLDLSGCLSFKSFLFRTKGDASCREDEPPEVGHFSQLHLIVESLDDCPVHPQNNMPKFQFRCYYKEDKPLLTRNLEKLISVGLCVCTNLYTFSKSICGLERLGKLQLEGDFLDAPKDLAQLECLENLDLSGTKIKHLPDGICMLKHLKSLDLWQCSLLEKLPEDFGQLECLISLDLSRTKIKHLPDSICMLKHLKSLDLWQCSLLEKLPEDFGQLECLEELDLSGTKIKLLPDSICMLKCLSSLSLRDCSLLEKLPEDIGQLECVENLDLSGTKIKHLPDDICEKKLLKSAGLRSCHLGKRKRKNRERLQRPDINNVIYKQMYITGKNSQDRR